ncbi:MAG TPA: polysaccharide pyruvyl transferase family protein [Methylotenera sp.]|nr:polysaccharide pyruvyl transferase family protein [Methylotenera sp.]
MKKTIFYLRAVNSIIKQLGWKLRFYYRILTSGQEPRLFYLMGLGDKFPNLGDQAQAAAIPLWLAKHFEMPIIELKNYETSTCLATLQSLIRSDDIVFLHSGGNFGDDWYDTQLDRESIISALGNNKIVQLPQTIFYSDSEGTGQKVSKSQEVINAHPALLIFGRDLHSQEIAKKLFNKTKILARPDMVLSLQDIVNSKLASEIGKRSKIIKKILLIMRNDKEGVFDLNAKNDMFKMLTNAGYEAHIWDTDVSDTFPNGSKFKTLSKYLKFISEFDAVVTDRYHGLIFSVLVKRPCVVLNTHNHKLTSAFDWFEEVNYVKRITLTNDLITTLSKMQTLDEYISPKWNDVHFDSMAKEVKNFIYHAN